MVKADIRVTIELKDGSTVVFGSGLCSDESEISKGLSHKMQGNMFFEFSDGLKLRHPDEKVIFNTKDMLFTIDIAVYDRDGNFIFGMEKAAPGIKRIVLPENVTFVFEMDSRFPYSLLGSKLISYG